jgi:hypothetical protein
MFRKVAYTVFVLFLFTVFIDDANASDNDLFKLREFSLGVSYAYRSNIFWQYADADPERVAGLNANLFVEMKLGEKTTLIPGLVYRASRYQEYRSASYPELLTSLQLKHGRHRLSAEFSRSSGRLLYVSNTKGEILFERQELVLGYKGRFLRSLSFKLEYEREKENYDELSQGRDMTSNGLKTKIYFNIKPNFTPQIGFGLIGERAFDPVYSKDKREIWVGSTLYMNNNTLIYFRYKIARKNYITDFIEHWNYDRHDTYHSVHAEVRIPVYKFITIILKNYFIKGISTRDDRNFTDNEFTIETKFIF